MYLSVQRIESSAHKQNHKLFASEERGKAGIHARSMKRTRKGVSNKNICISPSLRYGAAGSIKAADMGKPGDVRLCLHERAICSAISFPDVIARRDHRVYRTLQRQYTHRGPDSVKRLCCANMNSVVKVPPVRVDAAAKRIRFAICVSSNECTRIGCTNRKAGGSPKVRVRRLE